eukprot:CCRYP_014105-RA/>CCRYP_014105-RA protein AED:0.40 eAED:0.44 QI:0/0/0/1/0/0/2/0/207
MAVLLGHSLTKVLYIYQRGGVIVSVVLMDMEFEPLADILTWSPSTFPPHESMLAKFSKDVILPQKFEIHLISFVIFWLNDMPAINGIPISISPQEIVTQQKVDFQHHCRVAFCAYVEASEDVIMMNTMREQTHGCVDLGPPGNLEGSNKCFNLETCMVVKRRVMTKLPIPDRVNKCISYWGQNKLNSQTSLSFSIFSRIALTGMERS